MDTKTDHRLPAIDLLRGLVMVLMALDHTRDYFSDQLQFDPSDPAKASPALYFTRWVSHFCAPVFIFLAGTGASLAGDRGMTKPQLARFLLVRGFWLVVLELTLVRWGWWFAFDYHFIVLMVIWAIGISMIVLAGLIFLPRPLIMAVGLTQVVGQHVVERVEYFPARTTREIAAVLLFQDGDIPLWPGYSIFAPYKIVPWCGVMALGYAIGPVFRWSSGRRRKTLLLAGALLTVAFVVVRGANGFGDPRPWSRGATWIQSVMSFLRCEKYPPSLCYLLMTLGPALMALAAFDRPAGWWGRRLIVIGRVPLFFYLLHLPLIHILAMLASYWRMGFVASWLQAPAHYAQAPPGYGYPLPVVYMIWAIVVALLYLPCVWFAERKRRARGGWMSYL